MIDAVLVPVFACLNRLRGGGLGARHLPGHPRFYAAGLAGLAALPFVGAIDAACVAVSYLAWAWLPWGRWFDLGRLPLYYVRRTETPFEKLIGRLPNDHARFTARNLIGLVPAAVLLSPLFLLIAPLQTAAYEAGWRTTPKTPTVTGEWITGILWGLFVWVLA